MAGEGEEDVVEGRSAESDVGDLDAGVDEVVEDAGQRGGAVGHRGGDAPGGTVDVDVDRATRRITAPVADGAAALSRVLDDLVDAGIEVSDIGLRRPTLDDVFLTLTGHAAEPADAATAERPTDERPTDEPEEVLS